jgi:hypothetical protein
LDNIISIVYLWQALATVASVIDGTGSVGAAAGPFLAGAVGMSHVFYLLMASDVLALCVSLQICYQYVETEVFMSNLTLIEFK